MKRAALQAEEAAVPSRDAMKRAAAQAAMAYVGPGAIVGVGTGSTVAFFIEALSGAPSIKGAVASSERTRALLEARGIAVLDANAADGVPVYVDGADEVDPCLRLVKGAGGALAWEKVLASFAQRFVCIVDETKRVTALGAAPVPVEALPIAEAFVSRQIGILGGTPERREAFTTDNGNIILDVRGLDLADPLAMELALDAIPGVLENGLFARRRADVLLVGAADGTVEEVEATCG